MLLITTSGLSYGSEAWYTKSSTDEMSGKQSWYAYSPKAFPTRAMNYPYTSTYSQAIVGCSNGSFWSYLYFSDTPNLTADDKIKDGRSVYYSKIKWDNELTKIMLIQQRGEKYLSVNSTGSFIKKIRTKKSFLLDLNWYGNPRSYFRYSLNGSSQAINKLEETCGPSPVWHSKEKRAEIFREKRNREKIKKIISENMYGTEFKINHNSSREFVKITVGEILSSEGFSKTTEHETAMIWSRPSGERNGQLNLDCGKTLWSNLWNRENFRVTGMMIIEYSNTDIRLKYAAKGLIDYTMGRDIEKKCSSTGRLENIILSAIADKKIDIEPKKKSKR